MEQKQALRVRQQQKQINLWHEQNESKILYYRLIPSTGIDFWPDASIG